MRSRGPGIILSICFFVLLVAPIPRATVFAGPPDPTPEPTLLPPISTTTGDRISPFYVGCGGDIAPAVNANYEQEVVELVNAERAAEGLPPLKRNVDLRDAARYHATDMGQDDYVDHASHDRVGGSLQWVCYFQDRVRAYYPDSPYVAENAAAGQDTPQEAMQSWMSSPGHRGNILDVRPREIGVGYYEGSGNEFYQYWVQNFGYEDGVFPLIINQEAATTPSSNVSLYIYGSWDEIRLRNDGGTWTDWRPFQNEMDWTLNPGVGRRTVSAEMRTADDGASSNDTICLVGPCFQHVYLPLVVLKN